MSVTDLAPPAGPAADEGIGSEDFTVHLAEFDGPFDLLLSLIARRRLDVTTLALSRVTDDFIAYIRGRGDDWGLDEASEFLVVAATLLDLKVARLLPGTDPDDDEDLALLEARDLLLARLLQYRAYKEVAGELATSLTAAARRQPRTVSLEPRYVGLLPELVLTIDAAGLAELAARAAVPRPVPQVAVDHIHAPAVSVREQAAILATRLRVAGRSSFRALVADCTGLPVVVGRFLALLELYREGAVAFEQVTPLGDLQVRWVAAADVAITLDQVSDEAYAAAALEPA